MKWSEERLNNGWSGVAEEWSGVRRGGIMDGVVERRSGVRGRVIVVERRIQGWCNKGWRGERCESDRWGERWSGE